ncbi:MAG: hypothetical protein HWN81_01965 [Candidatus Lokiarchaeota archaeon]|nr:hypothetical protein [Candidatus Lokiarchaeota archaeon]
MFDGIFNHEARVFTDNYELSGVNSVEFNYRSSSQTQGVLGTNRGFSFPGSAASQQFVLNRNLIYNDPVLNYTGREPIKASIFYNNGHYGFEKGYLTDYSINCAVGSVPRCASTFLVSDELKTGISGRNDIINPHPLLDIPSQGSISITCDNSTTNRVVGFNYSIKATRKPLYAVGQQEPCDVETIYPIIYRANASIEIDDAFLQDSLNFLDLRENKNLSLSINGRDGNQLQSVSIPNASLVSETVRLAPEGSLRLDINYIGHG